MPSSARAAGLRAEHLPEICVTKPAVWIQLVTQRQEVAESRIYAAQVLGVPGVHLAPVRPPADSGHDRLGVAEILLMRRGVVDVERDVRAVPAAGGGEPQIVRGRYADLGREAYHPLPAA